MFKDETIAEHPPNSPSSEEQDSTVEVVVNSSREQVESFNRSLVKRSDKIVHNTRVCRSKYFRISRLVKEGYLSSAEIAGRIMRDEIE